MTTIDRLKQLDLAYANGTPEVSDEEYDRLYAQVRGQFPDDPYFNTVGPAPQDTARSKVKHVNPMLSLEKIPIEQFGKWHESRGNPTLFLQDKVDGVACSIWIDKDGDIVRAATRGDGAVGMDVTHNVLKFLKTKDGQPVKLSRQPAELDLHVEVYMPLSVFNAKYSDSAANTRNTAAGALGSADPDNKAVYDLRIYPHSLYPLGDAAKRAAYESAGTFCWDTESAVRIASALWEVDPACTPDLMRSMERIASLIQQREDDTGTTSKDFEADGVVIRVASPALYSQLGATAHHPLGAVAIKYSVKSGETTLTGVEWQTAASGKITPVALLEPVLLSGATVTRATLHNVARLRSMGVGIGDTVEARRRGGVIPHIERVVWVSNRCEVTVPSTCPACGAPVRESGADIWCTEPETCSSAIDRRLVLFAQSIGVMGFGPSAAEQLRKAGATRLADLFLMADALTPACRSQVQARQKGKVSLADFLEALSVPGLGSTLSKAMAKKLKTLDRVVHAHPSDFLGLPALSHARAATLHAALMEALDPALLAQIKLAEPPAPGSTVMAGHVVVFTGSLTCLDRNAAQLRVEYLGGTAGGSSVTKDTTILVDASKPDEPPSSKRKSAESKAAKGQNIRILTEAEFIAMFPSFLSQETA